MNILFKGLNMLKDRVLQVPQVRRRTVYMSSYRLSQGKQFSLHAWNLVEFDNSHKSILKPRIQKKSANFELNWMISEWFLSLSGHVLALHVCSVWSSHMDIVKFQHFLVFFPWCGCGRVGKFPVLPLLHWRIRRGSCHRQLPTWEKNILLEIWSDCYNSIFN